MSPEPAASQRLPALVDAFAHTAQAIVDLGRACSDADLAQPTECPGWTVHDQISHVVGVEAFLEGHKDPRVEMPHYEHIRNDLGKKIEYAVQVRRPRTGTEVLTELEGVLAQRLAALRDPGLTDTSIIPGPFGPDDAVTVLLLRTFDVWTHEQDIRSALRRPGNLDSPAAQEVVGSLIRQLPRLIAKGAGLEPGHEVVLEVTGPDSAVTARAGVRVEVDDQGRPRGHPLAVDQADATGAVVNGNGSSSGDGASSASPRLDRLRTTISLSTEAFTRRAAGRRSVSDTEYRVVDGDPAIARRVLEALVVTH